MHVKHELGTHTVSVSSWVPAMQSVQETYGTDVAFGRVCSPFRPSCTGPLGHWFLHLKPLSHMCQTGYMPGLQFVRETYGTEEELQEQAVEWLEQQDLREFQREYEEELAAAAVQFGEAEVRASGAGLC